MRSDLSAGRLNLGLQWQFSFVNASHSVEENQYEPGIADSDQARRHVIDILLSDLSFSAHLGLSKRVGVELTMPFRVVDVKPSFLDADGRQIDGYQSIHHRDEAITGLGDMMLRHRYRLIAREPGMPVTLDLLGGLSLPTGNTEANPFERGRAGASHQHMFFGNGTVGPVGGLEGTYAFETWSLLAWSSVRASVVENGFGYLGPTQVASGVGARSGFGLEDWRFLLQPEIYFETAAEWSGEPAHNSGRTDLIGTAGAFWTPTPGFATHAVIKLPFTVRSSGGQLRMPVLFSLGAAYAFDLGGEAEP